jgi:hypothetical protein
VSDKFKVGDRVRIVGPVAVIVAVLALSSCSSASAVTTSATATPLLSPTATTATPLPSPMAPPSGQPTLGAPEAVFVAAYGPIVGYPAGGTDEFWADTAHTIELEVRFRNGQATVVTVTLKAGSWTATYTFDYCHAFLPSDTSQIYASGQQTMYHIGTDGTYVVILDLYGPGNCSIAIELSPG